MNAAEKAAELKQKYAGLDSSNLLKMLIEKEFPGTVTLVSSFGAESAILIHMVSEIDPGLPVTFIDTQKLFPETLAYRDLLAARFGLTNIRTIYPDYSDIQRDDPEGTLWERRAHSCCTIRKVKPLQKALKGYDAWITGRKRFQGGIRGELPVIESFEGRIKINPLAHWDAEKLWNRFRELNLPLHPLYEKGYLSIGCAPCTSLPTDPNDPRSGRWAGSDQKECGIHIGEDGQIRRTASVD